MSLLSRRCLEGEADHARFAVALEECHATQLSTRLLVSFACLHRAAAVRRQYCQLWEYPLLMGLSDE